MVSGHKPLYYNRIHYGGVNLKQVGIYQIRCDSTNKVYIGGSTDIAQRFRRHRHELNHNTHWIKEMQKDWNICGEDAFEFTIIKSCKEEELIRFEQDQLDGSKYSVYNVRKYVDSNKGVKLSDEARSKISIRMKGLLAGSKNPMHKSNYEYSDETRHKMSESHKGEKNHKFGKPNLCCQGENNVTAKLTKDDVLEIRELLHNGYSCTYLATKYSVSISNISSIKSRKIWKHI